MKEGGGNGRKREGEGKRREGEEKDPTTAFWTNRTLSSSSSSRIL